MKFLNYTNKLNNNYVKNKVSILCTCYENDFHETQLLIESLNNIKYDNFEFLLMIDDIYKEKYEEIYEYLKNNKNVKAQMFYSNKNVGNYTHYNNLWNISDGEFIFITEPNTIWNKNLLKECVNIFNNRNNIDVIQYKYNRYNCDNFNSYYNSDKIFNSNKDWYWGDAMLAFRRTIVDDIGYFDNVRFAGDSDLWKRIKKYIPDKIYYFNFNGFISIGSGESNKFTEEREKYWHSNILSKERYLYTNINNELILNYSWLENLSTMCKYINTSIYPTKIKILIISHNWDFIETIISDLDKTKYDIDKHDFLGSGELIKKCNRCLNDIINSLNCFEEHNNDCLFTIYSEKCNKYNIVFCEYFEVLVPILSKIKNKAFKLIIRLHSYEYYYDISQYNIDNFITYLDITDFNNIDKLIVINEWFKNKISEKYKINNIIKISNYFNSFKNITLEEKTCQRSKNIGVVGINPFIIKGFYDILLIFHEIIKINKDYKLYIKSKLNFNIEIPKYINKNTGIKYHEDSINLLIYLFNTFPDNIIIEQHSDDGGRSMNDFYNNIGYLLTASIQESFHCVIMEAGTAGCIPIIYSNPQFKNLDVSKTPNEYIFIEFSDINDIKNYIINNDRFNELSLNASSFYNNLNNSIDRFISLFNSFSKINLIEETYIIPNFNENKLHDYEDIIINNIGIYKKSIQLIIISNKINNNILTDLVNSWSKNYTYKDNSIRIESKCCINLFDLNNQNININFQLLLGINNADTENINIIINDKIIKNINTVNIKKNIIEYINNNSDLNEMVFI